MSEKHRTHAQEKTSYLAMSIPIRGGVGVPLGVMLGVAPDKTGLMSVGIACSPIIGVALDQQRRQDNAGHDAQGEGRKRHD
jgi:hypothetical protein